MVCACPKGKSVPKGGPGYWPPEAVHVIISGAVSVTLCGKRATCLGLSQRSRDERSFWIIGWPYVPLCPYKRAVQGALTTDRRTGMTAEGGRLSDVTTSQRRLVAAELGEPGASGQHAPGHTLLSTWWS